MKAQVNIGLLVTPSHPCSYLPDQQATTLFVAPEHRLDQRLYTALSQLGFRRSGRHVYRPHCEQCKACVPVRIPVQTFEPRRRHRRVLRSNRHITARFVDAASSDEYYALYADYIERRHADGDMYPPSREQFESFLLSSWTETAFLELREDDRLIAVAVTDLLEDGLSAIYTFFDVSRESISPGVLAILHQVEIARRLGLPYLYLGYWIEDSPKMRYKADFRPLEQFRDEQWLPVTNRNIS